MNKSESKSVKACFWRHPVRNETYTKFIHNLFDLTLTQQFI